MPISRRRWFAISALAPLATPATQPLCWQDDRFSETVANVVIRHAAEVVNYVTSSVHSLASPLPAASAIADLALAHFEETRFTNVLDSRLARLDPFSQLERTELAAIVHQCGMRVPEDVLAFMLRPKASGPEAGRPVRWTGVRGSLLDGFQIGMKTLADRVPMYVRATWEYPWPRIVRTPRVLLDPQLGLGLGRIEEAAQMAMAVGARLAPEYAGRLPITAGVPTRAAEMASKGGVAVFSIGIAVFLICFSARSRLAETHPVQNL